VLGLVLAPVSQARSIKVPNYSFEGPEVPWDSETGLISSIDNWTMTLQPSYYEPFVQHNLPPPVTNAPWFYLSGVFLNPPDYPGYELYHITNLDGNQAALMPMLGLSSLYPSTDSPTSLITIQGGQPVGLGLLIDQYLARTPKVFFCPGADQPVDMDAELAKVGTFQAQSSYYYRHAGNTMMYDEWTMTVAEPPNMRLANLGDNRQGKPIRALVIYTAFQCSPGLAAFGVTPKTKHKARWVNVLYVDGHVASLANRDGKLTVSLKNYGQLSGAFGAILGVFEQADEEP
jgi:prepilin-type processing-associated H-X9-DG protein